MLLSSFQNRKESLGMPSSLTFRGEKYGKCDADYEGFHPLPAPEFIYTQCSRHLESMDTVRYTTLTWRSIFQKSACCRGFPGEITLVCIGALHNLAKSLESHPDLPELVRELVEFSCWGLVKMWEISHLGREGPKLEDVTGTF